MSAATLRALAYLGAQVPVDRLNRVWLFPPRQLGERESGLLVAELLPDGDSAVSGRRLYTLRYEFPRERRAPPSFSLEEQGTAPGDRIERVVAGVLRRTGGNEAPRQVVVGGDAARWQTFLAEFGAAPLDPAFGE